MTQTENVTGYCTITYKLRLYSNHIEFLELTKQIYNETVLAYYNLLLEHQEFLELSNQYCLRELERLTIISRDGKKPENYLDIDIPTYLRRAAINQAIGSVRSYISKLEKYKHSENKKGKEPNRTTVFECSPVFYKGMYKDLEKGFVSLKLWNGQKWKWYPATLKGRTFEKEVETLSPTLVLHSKYVMFHVPVRQEVEDVRPVKQRMQEKDVKVCGVSFSNYENFAICAVLDKHGIFQKAKFIKGGETYKKQTASILAKIKKHRQINKTLTDKDHKTYWEKLNHIDQNTAHKVSKEIVDFCLENQVKVIALAKVEEDVDAFQYKVGKHSPIYLRRKIIGYLEYKAFKNGILITTVRQNYTASRCYQCRAKIKRKQSNFICENGHAGNYYFNTAMNIGKMCLKKFGNI